MVEQEIHLEDDRVKKKIFLALKVDVDLNYKLNCSSVVSQEYFVHLQEQERERQISSPGFVPLGTAAAAVAAAAAAVAAAVSDVAAARGGSCFLSRWLSAASTSHLSPRVCSASRAAWR